MVLPSSSTVTISLAAGATPAFLAVTVDGQAMGRLGRQDTLTVRLSPHPLPHLLYSRAEPNLAWGRPALVDDRCSTSSIHPPPLYTHLLLQGAWSEHPDQTAGPRGPHLPHLLHLLHRQGAQGDGHQVEVRGLWQVRPSLMAPKSVKNLKLLEATYSVSQLREAL